MAPIEITTPRSYSIWTYIIVLSCAVLAQCTSVTHGRTDWHRSRGNRQYAYGVSPEICSNLVQSVAASNSAQMNYQIG